jgi:predicted secreted protein
MHTSNLARFPRTPAAPHLMTLLALCAMVLAPLAQSRAGDIAGHQVIGFSPDASHFAFIEYGSQDGSGAAYANLYILDMAADRYVGGSPFKIGGGEGNGLTISGAMDEAKVAASGALREFNITMPGLMVAAAPPMQQEIDRQSITFSSVAVLPMLSRDNPVTLSLETIPLPGPDYCFQPEDTVGYALTLTTVDGSEEIHRDARIPTSRGCAYDYEIASVWTPVESRGTAAVALISVISQGFEGQRDRRFAAIPLALPGL